MNINLTGTFRYLRYLSTEPGSQDLFCDVAEVEYNNTAGPKLGGTRQNRITTHA